MSGSIVVRIFADGHYVMHVEAPTRAEHRLLCVVMRFLHPDVDALAEKAGRTTRSLGGGEEGGA